MDIKKKREREIERMRMRMRRKKSNRESQLRTHLLARSSSGERGGKKMGCFEAKGSTIGGETFASALSPGRKKQLPIEG